MPASKAKYLVDMDIDGQTIIGTTHALKIPPAHKGLSEFTRFPERGEFRSFSAVWGTSHGNIYNPLNWDAVADILLTSLYSLIQDHIYRNDIFYTCEDLTNQVRSVDDTMYADDLLYIAATL